MDRHVATYEDEWRATLEDPESLRRFVSFVNSPDTEDPSISWVTERGQIRPQEPGTTLLAGAEIPVGAPG
jgi:nitrite reductase (NADH) large subunit